MLTLINDLCMRITHVAFTDYPNFDFQIIGFNLIYLSITVSI